MEFEGDVISFNISEMLSSQGMETPIKGTCAPLKKSVLDEGVINTKWRRNMASVATLNGDEMFEMNKRNGQIVKPYYMNLMKSTVEEVPLHAVPPDF